MLNLISMIIIIASLAILTGQHRYEDNWVLNLLIFLGYFLLYTFAAMVGAGYMLLFIQ